MPAPPDWLDSPVALDHWNRYGPTLNALGLLESLDAVTFALLCDGIACYLAARSQLESDELIQFVGENGHPAQNPLVSIIRQQVKGLRELCSEFGMTPASRTHLTGSTSVTRSAEALNPLEQLIAKISDRAGIPAAPKRKRKAAPKRKTTPKRKRKAAPKRKAVKA